MRDIIFKAKRRDNKKWIEGYYCKYGDNDCIIEPTTFGLAKGIGVIPETVGQYTGLLDKDGKKVFEGDVIKDLGGSMDGIPRVVIWNEVWMEFETYLVKSHWAYGTNNSRLWLMRNREIEVIGNIHDNPELLEVK